jgi:tetratricopeptide (TPR) repeat protein
MFVSPLRRLAALALGTILCGACAAGAKGSLSSRFVQPGKPAVDLGGRSPLPSPAAPLDSEKVQPAPDAAPPPATGLSIETFDKRLGAALSIETVRPTVENHLRVAEEYRRLQILDASAQHVELALKMSPHSAEANEASARFWRDSGFPERGLGAAYRATFYAPSSAIAQNTYGTLLAALGFREEARRAYERALDLDPTAAWVQNNLCDLERQLKRLQAAQQRCRAAIALDPELKAAHNNLALTLAANGDLAGARAEFLAGGDEASASYNMGLVYMAHGNYSLAADAFEAAIRWRPTFTAAKTRAHILRLYLLIGRK